MNQRGFATLEIIMVVVIIGILATIAVPNFSNVTEKANTAKIQSDLTTIDTAIQMYYMEKGDYPADIPALVTGKYLMDEPTPPTGKAFLKDSETSTKINATSYKLNDTKDRATLDGHTAKDFGLTKKTTTSSNSGGDGNN